MEENLKIPAHVALILDGNGRWAKKRGLPRQMGHKKGCETVEQIVEDAARLGIRYLTVYGFSTGNWKRPEEEVSALMQLFRYYTKRLLKIATESNVRVKMIGERSRFAADITEGINQLEEQTKMNTGLTFIIAVNYGGRDEITRAVKKVTKKPVIIKLSPNVTDIVSIAKACEEAGADGIALINTMMGMRIDLKTKKPVIANKMGGFSGSAIFPVAVRMVYQVAEAVNIPVIGMGGVSSAEDVIEMMLAGATAVEIGAANLVNPYICKEIIEDLPRVMEKYNIKDLNDIIGGARK